jgi:glycosyltransferase involved in cell wall biosynthesis
VYPFDENGPALALYAMLKGMLESRPLNSELAIQLLVGVENPKYLGLDWHPLLNVPMASFVRNPKSINGFKTTVSGCSKFVSKTQNADVVFYNNPPTDVMTISYPYIARLAGKRQVYYLHGSLVNERVNSKSRRYFHSIARLGFFDKVIIPLESFKNYVSELICPYKFIATIPEGVVTPWFEGPSEISLEGDPVVLFTGRLAQVKRIDVLLKAFSTITSHYPSARLYLAGSGPIELTLKKLCMNLRLSGKVVFLGHVRHDNLRALYRSSDIFVLPSDAELMSVSLLEAMASKCAVLVSDIAATEVIENGQNGLVFPRGDFKTLASNLSLLIDDESLRKKLSSEAYLTIKQKFDYRVVGSRLTKEIYNIARN